MMKKVDKIKRMSIKDAFRYESREMTPWLCENIDVISDAIGIELLNAEREQSTGNFSVDIKAENSSGEIVVIENQFGQSNHDHLGKLLTYLTSFEAKVAIWIVEKPKQEHINTLNWLNEMDNGCNFYLLSVEAIKIGESNLAPLLTTIVRPSDDAKKIGKIKKEDEVKGTLRNEFWSILLQILRERNIKSFKSISATKDTWIGATAGVRGLTYMFWLNKNNSRIELRIDRGKDADSENIKIFTMLKENIQDIEQKYGSSLNWVELEGHRACAIRTDTVDGGYISEPSEWQHIAKQMADKMSKLIDSTKPYINKLNL